MQLELIKKFKKNDFHLKYIRTPLYWRAPTYGCLVRFWMLPSLPTLIFSVYMFTLLLTVLEKTVIKKNRNCNVNQLNQDEKRYVFD